MEADFGSTMPRYSVPSAYPHSIEVLGRLDLVAVMQRRARVGHDGFADVEAFKDFRAGVGHQSDPNLSRLNRVPFDHLNRQMVNGGTRYRHAATAFGVDVGAGKHANLERRIVGQRYPDMAELGGAVDLRRNLPDPPDEVGRIVPANARGRPRTELQQMDARHLGIQFDFVVDGNLEHRSGLRRGRRADDGLDLGDEAGGGSAQRRRCGGPAAALASRLRRGGAPAGP